MGSITLNNVHIITIIQPETSKDHMLSEEKTKSISLGDNI